MERILIDREHRFWKNRKSVHDETRIDVHDEPEYATIFNLTSSSLFYHEGREENGYMTEANYEIQKKLCDLCTKKCYL